MRSDCNLIVNGRSIKARLGETLVDAGLGGWVVVPHDCCSGQCETCRVTVVKGAVDDNGTGEGRTVLACQATLAGDAEIVFEDVPALTKAAGLVSLIEPLSPEVLEVRIDLQSTFDYRPGQYASVKFAGFPARDYSPTLRLDGAERADELVLHVRRLPGGVVSTQLGATIRAGHRVQIRGPFGHAFLRDGAGPLVLVSGGTGWAPIWSLASAARRSQRHRELVVIAGARDQQNLYMRRALDWLVDDGVREVTGVVEFDARWPNVAGLPTHYLPLLGPEDNVYVAGPPGLVDAVKAKAALAAARCYADPFLPGAQGLSLIDRILRMARTPRAEAEAPAIAPGGGLAAVLAPFRRQRPPTQAPRPVEADAAMRSRESVRSG